MVQLFRYLNQKATYWQPTGEFDAYGNSKFYKPVLLDCRWEDAQELFVNAFGDDEVSQAKVYVDRDVVTKGYLILGDYRDTDESTTTTETTSDGYVPHRDAREIRNCLKVSNTTASQYLRVAWLKRTWV